MQLTKSAKARQKRIRNKTGKLLRRSCHIEKQQKGKDLIVISTSNTFANTYETIAKKMSDQIDHELKYKPVLCYKIKKEEIVPDLEVKRLALLKGLRSLKENGLLAGFLRSLFNQSRFKKLSQSQVLAGYKVLQQKLDFLMKGNIDGNNRKN